MLDHLVGQRQHPHIACRVHEEQEEDCGLPEHQTKGNINLHIYLMH
jgi:hypothetical protein